MTRIAYTSCLSCWLAVFLSTWCRADESDYLFNLSLDELAAVQIHTGSHFQVALNDSGANTLLHILYRPRSIFPATALTPNLD